MLRRCEECQLILYSDEDECPGCDEARFYEIYGNGPQDVDESPEDES